MGSISLEVAVNTVATIAIIAGAIWLVMRRKRR
jgi:hypothetical protein